MNDSPEVKGGAVAYLTLDGAIDASKFYEKSFGAEVARINPPDEKGRTMHVHLYINGGSVMFSDAFPEHGHPLTKPSGFTLMLQVEDVDAWHTRAVSAGCDSVTEPQNMFWGGRYAQVKDPYGVVWGMNGPQKT